MKIDEEKKVAVYTKVKERQEFIKSLDAPLINGSKDCSQVAISRDTYRVETTADGDILVQCGQNYPADMVEAGDDERAGGYYWKDDLDPNTEYNGQRVVPGGLIGMGIESKFGTQEFEWVIKKG